MNIIILISPILGILFTTLSCYYNYSCSKIDPLNPEKNPELYKGMGRSNNSANFDLPKFKKGFEVQGKLNSKAAYCTFVAIFFQLITIIFAGNVPQIFDTFSLRNLMAMYRNFLTLSPF